VILAWNSLLEATYSERRKKEGPRPRARTLWKKSRDCGRIMDGLRDSISCFIKKKPRVILPTLAVAWTASSRLAQDRVKPHVAAAFICTKYLSGLDIQLARKA
jgi:hypothetical protein